MASGKRSCRGCIFYNSETGICFRYGIRIANPDDPFCAKLEGGRSSSLVPASGSVNYDSPPRGVTVSSSRVQAPRARSSMSVRRTQALKKDLMEIGLEPTGIAGLDEILGGGFIRGKTYLVAGETGTGKTLFSIQFLLTGVQLNEPGVYLAIDEPSSHVIEGIRRFGWDVRPLIRKKMLQFLDMKEHFDKIYLKGGRIKIEPRYVAENILEHVERINAKRLVIDPIAPLMYTSQADVLWVREYLRELIFTLERKGDVTTVMTSEVPTGSTSFSRFGVEEFLATGIIVLALQELKGKVVRIMYIRKMRWSPVPPSKYIFRIEPGRGLILEGPLNVQY